MPALALLLVPALVVPALASLLVSALLVPALAALAVPALASLPLPALASLPLQALASLLLPALLLPALAPLPALLLPALASLLLELAPEGALAASHHPGRQRRRRNRTSRAPLDLRQARPPLEKPRLWTDQQQWKAEGRQHPSPRPRAQLASQSPTHLQRRSNGSLLPVLSQPAALTGQRALSLASGLAAHSAAVGAVGVLE